MTVQQTPRQIRITLPGSLYEWLDREARRRDQDISTVVRDALEQYARDFDLVQTRTWELCGTLSVSEPEPAYLVGTDEHGQPLTNYAERVEEALLEDR